MSQSSHRPWPCFCPTKYDRYPTAGCCFRIARCPIVSPSSPQQWHFPERSHRIQATAQPRPRAPDFPVSPHTRVEPGGGLKGLRYIFDFFRQWAGDLRARRNKPMCLEIATVMQDFISQVTASRPPFALPWNQRVLHFARQIAGATSPSPPIKKHPAVSDPSTLLR